MTKTMLAARPGALTEILKVKKLTMAGAAKGVSRNTLRAIDRGQPVKADTLAKAATKLRVPLAHLLPSQAAVESDAEEAREVGRPSPMERAATGEDRRLTRNGLLVKPVGPEDIEFELLWISRITWTVDPKIPREAHPAIRELGAVLKTVTTGAVQADSEQEWGSLEHQLQAIEAWDEVKQKLVRLEEHGVHLLTGGYLYWTVDEIEHPYERGIVGYAYNSRMTAHLHVAPVTTKSERVLVHEGPKPPQYSPRRGPTVYVNDRELSPEPAARPANDDPPADTANDDDIPF